MMWMSCKSSEDENRQVEEEELITDENDTASFNQKRLDIFLWKSNSRSMLKSLWRRKGETLSEVLEGKIQYNAILRMAKPQYEDVLL